ncbi:MAG TPA: DUF3108 domain-containing protein [Verrucomicrobiae bacterium]|jgi:hypothetical protein|nr:DUF3108 domain-containing protein [Verrucomicrobiae bacterium]
MSYRKVIGIAGLLALGCAAGGYYWVRERNAGLARAWASARASDSLSAPATDLPPIEPTGSPSASTPDKTGEPVVDPGLPLRRGEVLEYTANVSSLTNVANLKLQVGEHRDFLGKSAWHLQAFAHTESPLRMVFELDDQFDSYSDAQTMASLQYEMHLSERGQKVDSVQRMTATGKEPAPPDASETRVLPGTRDPLGMMQFLRNVDWTKTAEVRSPVYDGHKLYDVRAKLVSAAEAVTVPAGNFKTSKIEIRVFENGQEMKDARFTIYFANNAARAPVLLEAVMPFATAQVQLVHAK